MINKEGDITKLPKWAQDKIRTLEFQRQQALDTLNKFKDRQKPTNTWFEEHPCLGEQAGPSLKRCYIDSDEVTMRLGKEEVTMRIASRYAGEDPHIRISTGWSRMLITPDASNVIRIEEAKR